MVRSISQKLSPMHTYFIIVHLLGGARITRLSFLVVVASVFVAAEPGAVGTENVLPLASLAVSVVTDVGVTHDPDHPERHRLRLPLIHRFLISS